MKKQILIIMLLCLIGVVSCKDDYVETAPICSCPYRPFVDAYSMFWYDNPFDGNETYFVKGIALDVVNEYGCRIKLIEDLKGNFPKNINTTFIVWGENGCRVDDFNIYKLQDTLIMLLGAASDRKYKITNSSRIYLEKIGDYITFDCSHSVLKLSNGYAIGHIFCDNHIIDIDTMLYEDLQKRLEELKQ